MRRPVAAVLAVALLAPRAGAQEPPVPPPAAADAQPLDLETALALARVHDPDLAAARLRRAIDEASLALAGERPNPEARYEHAKETPHDAVSLAQPLELGGKRGRRLAAARASLQTGAAELAQAEAQAENDTRRAYAALSSAQRRQTIARELQALAARAQAVASEREQAGDVSKLDVLEADLALDAAENDAAALTGELLGARAELNAHVGLPPAAPTTVVDAVDAAIPPLGEAQPNAALGVLDRQIAESEAKAALARAERFPDVTVEGTVTHGSEPEFVWGYRVAGAVVVPLFTNHRAAVRVEEATLAQLRAQRAGMGLRIAALAAGARARAEAARTSYLRYRDRILPESRKVEDMAQESYRAGQTGLPVLLQALQAARELRLKALQAALDYEAALADLHQATRLGPRP